MLVDIIKLFRERRAGSGEISIQQCGPPAVSDGAALTRVAIIAGQLKPSVVEATPTNEHGKSFLGFTSSCITRRCLNNSSLQITCLSPRTKL